MAYPLDERTGEWTHGAFKETRDDARLKERSSLLTIAHGIHQDYLMVAYADLYPERVYLQWLRRIAYPIYLKTRHWATVRRLALEAAHNQCVLCGSSKRLEVHHKSYANLGRENLSDLSVLCRDCHAKYHKRDRQ